MDAKPNYNEGYLVVTPQYAGKWGGGSIGGMKYKDDSHLKSMANDIKRHV